MSLADIDEALVAFAVHLGFPDQRLALARRLFDDGISATDVERLGRHCEATVDGQAAAARVLAALLQDPEKRTRRLAEVAKHFEARRRLDDPAFGDKPRGPGPVIGEESADWERDQRCRQAFCRVHGDRKPHREVAAELGVSLADLPAMLERGRALSVARVEKPIAHAWDDETTQAERRERFVREMRAGSAAR